MDHSFMNSAPFRAWVVFAGDTSVWVSLWRHFVEFLKLVCRSVLTEKRLERGIDHDKSLQLAYRFPVLEPHQRQGLSL